MPTAPSTRYGLTGPTGGDAPDNPLAFSTLIGQIEANLSTLIAARTIGDVGQLNQTRAGRVLTAADFTDLGLAAPAGLWNLSDLTDVSGNGRALTNKGAVPFGKDILGNAAGAAIFSGSSGQALWRADEAALSILTGSWGCWFRTAKRSTSQSLISKMSAGVGQQSWDLALRGDNTLQGWVSTDGGAGGGNNATAIGTTDVCDDRWHFAVVTFDGSMLRLYVDGAPEASVAFVGVIFDGTAPLNIGGRGADAGTAASVPHYGRVDEAFVTPEVLSEDQIRLLMCAKVAHGSPRTPRRTNVNVRRSRRGVELAQADFTALGLAAPLRIYNRATGDVGSHGIALTGSGGVVGAGVAGPSGLVQDATHYDGVDDFHQGADTNLPAGAASRTLMAWFKTTSATGNDGILSYGNLATGLDLVISNGAILFAEAGGGSGTGPFVADGQWHFVVWTADNAAADGVKNKLYLDGRLVASSTTMVGPVLLGANGFHIGRMRDTSTGYFGPGQIARVVVCAYAMTPDQIASIYSKRSQDLGLSPYSAGEYVERMDANNLYVLSEPGLDGQDQVELEVAA